MDKRVCALVLLWTTAAAPRLAFAQGRVIVGLEAGQQLTIEATPTHYSGTHATQSIDKAIGATVGVAIRPWLVPELSLRITGGRAIFYRSASIGLRGGSRRPTGFTFMVGLSEMEWPGGYSCVPTCPRTTPMDRRMSVEATAGAGLVRWGGFGVGPQFWVLRSLSPQGPLYTEITMFGLGVRATLR